MLGEPLDLPKAEAVSLATRQKAGSPGESRKLEARLENCLAISGNSVNLREIEIQ
jgi:hypothetical protein